jgi:hypothetical protein
MLANKLLGAAKVAGAANYVEDVFSTWLYTGNGSAQTINNGIALGDDYGGSVYFSGSTAYLSIPDNAAFDFGTGSLTVEAWIYTGTKVTYQSIIGTFDGSSRAWYLHTDSSGFVVYGISASTPYTASVQVCDNAWHHIAMVRNGASDLRLYVDGVLAGSQTDSTNVDTAAEIRIGSLSSAATRFFNGYISNVRVVKGTAVYTSAFTPPTSPLTAISGTSLLTCQAPNATADNSSNAFTITVTNAVAQNGGGAFTDSTANKGGLVWLKGRSGATDHALYDTARGATFDLVSNSTAAQTTQSTGLTAFNSNGFSLGALAKLNTNAATYASWTFRKQAKFFDVVTYTGDGTDPRNISHNLGSAPGCIIIKNTSAAAQNWAVYHRSLNTTGADQYLRLNTTSAVLNGAGAYWNYTNPTSTVFTLGDDASVNQSGVSYVAYLFAHDAGGFGLSGTDNVISCGSFTSTGSPVSVNLGYEAQWLLVKNSGATGSWLVMDNMRGTSVASNTPLLFPNGASAENDTAIYATSTATGFTASNFASGTYIYIAIRRPMKPPTSGTQVFSPVAWNEPATTTQTFNVGFPADLTFESLRTTSGYVGYAQDRLRGSGINLITASNAAETTGGGMNFDSSVGAYINASALFNNSAGRPDIAWIFRRAPGFFDVVCDTGTASGHTIDHGLTVVPELMIRKKRNSATNSDWVVWHTAFTGTNKYLYLNSTAAEDTNAAFWTTTAPTSTVFSVGTGSRVNNSGDTYVTYLFATVAGVSKVGSYTGTGTTLTIDCGFTAGARFVLIKRTSSTGDWYVWDTARGIISGNDPYLLLNSTAAEVTNTDYIDPVNSGFQISSTAPVQINQSGGTFIFLAIA